MLRIGTLGFVAVAGLLLAYLGWTRPPAGKPVPETSCLYLPVPMDCNTCFLPGEPEPPLLECDAWEAGEGRTDPVTPGNAPPIYLRSSISWTTERLPIG